MIYERILLFAMGNSAEARAEDPVQGAPGDSATLRGRTVQEEVRVHAHSGDIQALPAVSHTSKRMGQAQRFRKFENRILGQRRDVRVQRYLFSVGE